MKLDEKQQVFECISRNGDGWWTDLDDEGNDNSEWVFEEILELLRKDGFDLVLVSSKK